jgi:hypothetical protein
MMALFLTANAMESIFVVRGVNSTVMHVSLLDASLRAHSKTFRAKEKEKTALSVGCDIESDRHGKTHQ